MPVSADLAPALRDSLDAALGALLVGAGARAVRVVDGRTGRVVGAAGESTSSGQDDSAVVAELLRDRRPDNADNADNADDAGDVLVTTDRSVHLLRSTPVTGVFVHLRLDLELADTGRAHRALGDPRLHAAVRRALEPPDSRPSGPEIPRPRSRSVPVARQPALAALVVGPATAPPSADHGLRAAWVLTELLEVGRAAGTLPRRRPSTVRARPATVVTAGLPERTWARDVDTMRRLLAGLRRLG